jgi:hypothetical protein
LWDVDLDETTDGPDKLYAQLEGPSVYLYFQLPGREIVDQMIQFLEHPPGSSKEWTALRIGSFGRTPVTLRWDDEELARCFLVIGSGRHFCMHWSLVEEEITLLIEALRQVKEDLETEQPGANSK